MNIIQDTINNVVGSTFNFFTNIGNSLAQVKQAIKSIFTLIQTSIEFIPQPFLNITLIFLTLMLSCILFKVIKGII